MRAPSRTGRLWIPRRYLHTKDGEKSEEHKFSFKIISSSLKRANSTVLASSSSSNQQSEATPSVGMVNFTGQTVSEPICIANHRSELTQHWVAQKLFLGQELVLDQLFHSLKSDSPAVQPVQLVPRVASEERIFGYSRQYFGPKRKQENTLDVWLVHSATPEESAA